MKILQICQYFHPYLAGQERFVMELSRHLATKGNEVSVYTMNYLGTLPEKENIEHIHVNRFKMLISPLNNPISIDYFRAFKMIKYYDVVHIHNEHSFISLLTCIFNIYHKKPIILTCHGQLTFGSPLKDFFEKLYSITFGRLIFTLVTGIVVLSEDDLKYISNFGIKTDKIRIIPNGIDNIYLDSKTLDSTIYDEITRRFQGKKVILYVGRLIPRKGIDILIKSLEDVIRNFDNASFVIVGNGNYRKKAEDFCKDKDLSSHVIFLNNLSDEVLFSYYRRADIFILPSLSEGLPTTILEAMYFNTAIAASNIPGVRCHFSDFAILFQPKNKNAISQTLIDLLNDEDHLNKLKEQSKEIVMQNYTWKRISESYLDFYTKILGDVTVE